MVSHSVSVNVDCNVIIFELPTMCLANVMTRRLGNDEIYASGSDRSFKLLLLYFALF